MIGWLSIFMIVFGVFGALAHTPQHEQGISSEQIKRVLDTVVPIHSHERELSHRAFDLERVNSSVEKPPINFTALDESIKIIEHKVDDLLAHVASCKTQLADIKHQVAQQTDAEEARLARITEYMRVTVHDLEEKNIRLAVSLSDMQVRESATPCVSVVAHTPIHLCDQDTDQAEHIAQALQGFSCELPPDA